MGDRLEAWGLADDDDVIFSGQPQVVHLAARSLHHRADDGLSVFLRSHEAAETSGRVFSENYKFMALLRLLVSCERRHPSGFTSRLQVTLYCFEQIVTVRR